MVDYIGAELNKLASIIFSVVVLCIHRKRNSYSAAFLPFCIALVKLLETLLYWSV